VAPCAVIAFLTYLIQHGFKFKILELLWTFSIYLESIAILPQLIVLQRYREVENLTGNYIFFMGAYRALYILNWIYRSHTEKHYTHHWVVYFCGVLQTLLYADFFYYYFLSKSKGGKFTLPTTGSKK
jgi:ER lumen protein retaining receptor